MPPRVILTARYPENAVEILRDFDVLIRPADQPRNPDQMVRVLEGATAAMTLVTDPVTREVLQAHPGLKVIGQFGVGTNNIDLPAARELGVVVTNTPDVLTAATADLTLGLILATVRRFIEGDQMMRNDRFAGWQPLLLLGRSLDHMRLGIVGMGRIGEAVARRAQAFGMSVVFSSRRELPDLEERLGAVQVSFEELLRTSDVVSLHTPLTAETRHMIDQDALGRMKQGSYLVNTSRGEVIDERALAQALRAGHLGGAGLDVFESEPRVRPELAELPQCVLLPHLGSATWEARREMARLAASGIRDVLRGIEPRHRVA